MIDSNTLKAVIFDLDGVLVDTARLHYRAWKEISDQLGLLFNEEMNEKLKGVSRTQSLEIILKENGVEINDGLKERLLERKNSDYVTLLDSLSKSDVLPGVFELIKSVRDKGLTIALGSASKNAKKILAITGLETYFDHIVDGNMVTLSKPDPEVFLTAADLLNVDANQCLVIEDAASGVQAALSAGMQVVGVGEPSQLSAATIVVPDLDRQII